MNNKIFIAFVGVFVLIFGTVMSITSMSCSCNNNLQNITNSLSSNFKDLGIGSNQINTNVIFNISTDQPILNITTFTSPEYSDYYENDSLVVVAKKEETTTYVDLKDDNDRNVLELGEKMLPKNTTVVYTSADMKTEIPEKKIGHKEIERGTNSTNTVSSLPTTTENSDSLNINITVERDRSCTDGESRSKDGINERGVHGEYIPNDDNGGVEILMIPFKPTNLWIRKKNLFRCFSKRND